MTETTHPAIAHHLFDKLAVAACVPHACGGHIIRHCAFIENDKTASMVNTRFYTRHKTC